MSITGIVVNEGVGEVEFVASSDVSGAVFRWFVNGVFWLSEVTGVLRVPLDAGGRLHVDVFDDDDPYGKPLEGVMFRGVIVRWEGESAAVRYRVERFVGAAWVELGVVEVGSAPRERGFEFVVGDVEDGEDVRVRVVGVDVTDGSDGEVVVLDESVEVLRVPDVPVVGLSVSGGVLTVAAG